MFIGKIGIDGLERLDVCQFGAWFYFTSVYKLTTMPKITVPKIIDKNYC